MVSFLSYLPQAGHVDVIVPTNKQANRAVVVAAVVAVAVAVAVFVFVVALVVVAFVAFVVVAFVVVAFVVVAFVAFVAFVVVVAVVVDAALHVCSVKKKQNKNSSVPPHIISFPFTHQKSQTASSLSIGLPEFRFQPKKFPINFSRETTCCC